MSGLDQTKAENPSRRRRPRPFASSAPARLAPVYRSHQETLSELDKIKAENLKETLRQFQRYLVWGIGSALSYYILSSINPGSTNVNVPLPGAFVSVTTDFAKTIALAIFWIAGAMANYEHERAQRIVVSLGSNRKLVRAILTFPSLATEIYPVVRVAAVIIPAALVVFGLINEWTKSTAGGGDRLTMILLLFSPYLLSVS